MVSKFEDGWWVHDTRTHTIKLPLILRLLKFSLRIKLDVKEIPLFQYKKDVVEYYYKFNSVKTVEFLWRNVVLERRLLREESYSYANDSTRFLNYILKITSSNG